MVWGRRRSTAPIPVPEPGAAWPEIERFALTFNAYTHLDGHRNVRQLAGNVIGIWYQEGTLPSDIVELRAVLFFEQRTWHNEGAEPSGRDREFVDALLAELQYQTGGTVPGPPDPPYDGSHRPRRSV